MALARFEIRRPAADTTQCSSGVFFNIFKALKKNTGTLCFLLARAHFSIIPVFKRMLGCILWEMPVRVQRTRIRRIQKTTGKRVPKIGTALLFSAGNTRIRHPLFRKTPLKPATTHKNAPRSEKRSESDSRSPSKTFFTVRVSPSVLRVEDAESKKQSLAVQWTLSASSVTPKTIRALRRWKRSRGIARRKML